MQPAPGLHATLGDKHVYVVERFTFRGTTKFDVAPLLLKPGVVERATSMLDTSAVHTVASDALTATGLHYHFVCVRKGTIWFRRMETQSQQVRDRHFIHALDAARAHPRALSPDL